MEIWSREKEIWEFIIATKTYTINNVGLKVVAKPHMVNAEKEITEAVQRCSSDLVKPTCVSSICESIIAIQIIWS